MSDRRGQFKLSRWGNIAVTQGVEPAIGITDYSMDVVVLELDDLWYGSRRVWWLGAG